VDRPDPGNAGQPAYRVEGDYEKARAYILQSAQMMRKIEDPWALAMAAFSMGMLAYLERDYAQAQEQYEESLVLWESMGDRFFILLPTSGLADVARQRADYDRRIASTE